VAAPVAEATTTENTAPSEPEWDEVWFPGGKRPDNRRHQQGRRGGAEGGEGEGRPRHERQRSAAKRRPEGEVQDLSRRRPEGEVQDLSKAQHLNPKPKFERPKTEARRFDKPRGDAPKFDKPVREKREAVFDPDSPFAALAALRNKKD
jgi:ATP-dependent RNA helicase SUPV3L1/SUV3